MLYHLIITKNHNRIDISESKDKNKLINKIHKKYSNSKYNAKIVGIPNVLPGLKLYKEGVYYKTVIGISDSVVYLIDINNINKETIPSAFRLGRIEELIIKGLIDSDIEKYDTLKEHKKLFFDHRNNEYTL